MDAPDWAQLSDADLLERRISSLGLKIDGTPLAAYVQQLHDELAAKGLAFFPRCHVGDEWFVPVGIPAIFIPFFLVHERLQALEKSMILEVEGDTPEEFMKLLRHEAAHAYEFAYDITGREDWRATFGEPSNDETPEFYRPRPHSHSYVINLDDWYAQAHPDEDFAETFATWLTPGLDWRSRYKGWKALHKVEYVESLMSSIAGQPPTHTPKYRVSKYDCLNVKLRTYYTKKRKQYADTYPDFYDGDLRQLFPAPPNVAGKFRASRYLRQRRLRLMNSVCQWTNERKYRVDQLLDRLIARCDQLGLVAQPDDPAQDFRISAYVSTLVANYRFTGKFMRTK